MDEERREPVPGESVRVFGPRCTAAEVAAALASHQSAIVHGVDDAAPFQPLLDTDRILYLSRGILSERELAQLLAPRGEVSFDRYLDAQQLRRVALAQSVSELADALRAAIVRATKADRARCVLFDAGRQVLWTPDESDGDSAAAGLVSFALRSGVSLCIARAGDDPRFDPELDGDASDRFLATPVFARGRAIAVLVAARTSPPFEPAELAALDAIATHASPYLAAWLLDADDETPFRRHALREREQPAGAGPEPLRVDSAWTRGAPWLALATLVAVVLALLFVRVPAYATGRAIVRGDGAVVASFAATAPIDRGMTVRFHNQSLPIETAYTKGAQRIVITAKGGVPGTRGKAEVRVGTLRLLDALQGAAR